MAFEPVLNLRMYAMLVFDKLAGKTVELASGLIKVVF